MSYKAIDQNEWRDFLDSFAREHLGWLVTIKSLDTGQLPGSEEQEQLPAQIVLRQFPLEDIRESERENGMDVMLTVGIGKNENSILIEDVHHIYLQKTNSATRGLRIDSSDHTTTLLELRTPVSPESVDGLAAAEL